MYKISTNTTLPYLQTPFSVLGCTPCASACSGRSVASFKSFLFGRCPSLWFHGLNKTLGWGARCMMTSVEVTKAWGRYTASQRSYLAFSSISFCSFRFASSACIGTIYLTMAIKITQCIASWISCIAQTAYNSQTWIQVRILCELWGLCPGLCTFPDILLATSSQNWGARKIAIAGSQCTWWAAILLSRFFTNATSSRTVSLNSRRLAFRTFLFSSSMSRRTWQQIVSTFILSEITSNICAKQCLPAVYLQPYSW